MDLSTPSDKDGTSSDSETDSLVIKQLIESHSKYNYRYMIIITMANLSKKLVFYLTE